MRALKVACRVPFLIALLYSWAQLLDQVAGGYPRPFAWAVSFGAILVIGDEIQRWWYFVHDGDEPSKRYDGITRTEELEVVRAVRANRPITDVRLASAALDATTPRSVRKVRALGLQRAAVGVLVGIASAAYAIHDQRLIAACWIVGFVAMLASGEHTARTRERATVTRSTAEALLGADLAGRPGS